MNSMLETAVHNLVSYVIMEFAEDGDVSKEPRTLDNFQMHLSVLLVESHIHAGSPCLPETSTQLLPTPVTRFARNVNPLITGRSLIVKTARC
jgi:hypothetical protein